MFNFVIGTLSTTTDIYIRPVIYQISDQFPLNGIHYKAIDATCINYYKSVQLIGQKETDILI